MDNATICQWCDSSNTYILSRVLVTGLQHRCRECHGFTYALPDKDGAGYQVTKSGDAIILMSRHVDMGGQ